MKLSQTTMIVLAAVAVSSAVLGGFWWKQRTEDAREAARRSEAQAAAVRALQVERDVQAAIDTQAVAHARSVLKGSHGYTEDRIDALIAEDSSPALQRIRLEGEISLRESITLRYGAGLSPAQQRMQADEIIANMRAKRAAENTTEASATP